MLSHFSRVLLFVTLWTVAHLAPLSMGFSRQEYWSLLLCPPTGDLPDPGIEPVSLNISCIGRQIVTSTTWEAWDIIISCNRLGGLEKNINLFSYSSGGCKSKVKVLADLVSDERCLPGPQRCLVTKFSGSLSLV